MNATTVNLMKAATKKSWHLEGARQRLRERLHSKFSPSLLQGHSLFVQDGGDVIEKDSKHLQDARDRLRNRFQERFPALQPLPTNGYHRQGDGSDNREILDAARTRIHNHFQKKFLPDFQDFPATLTDAMQRLEDNQWGASHAVIITDTSYKIMAVNRRWEGLCGYRKSEATGKTMKALGFSGDSFTDRRATKALVHKLEGCKPAATHLVNRTKEGRLFTNYLRAKPLFQEGEGNTVIAYLGVVEDEGTPKKMNKTMML